MAYVKQSWENYPSTATPINATRLAYMEDGIFNASRFFNIRDFGAVGDGVTDDTAAIHAAMRAAMYGGTVEVPRGIFLISSPIGLWGADWEYDPAVLPESVRHVILQGTGGRYACTLKVNGAFPAISGLFDYCQIRNINCDIDNQGASGIDIGGTHQLLEHVTVQKWGNTTNARTYPSVAGVKLGSDTYDTTTGYLNRIFDVHVDSPESGRYGFGIDIGYRCTDSWLDRVNVGSTEANIMCQGGPLRISNSHLNGYPTRPRHNVLLQGGRRTFIFNNILESAREESIKHIAADEAWNTDLDQQFHIRGNNISNGGSDSPGTYAAIYLQGKNLSEKIRGVVIADNQIACEQVGDEWGYAVHLKWWDEITIVGNNWYDGFTEADPVELEACGTFYEVVGNGGRNTVTVI